MFISIVPVTGAKDNPRKGDPALAQKQIVAVKVAESPKIDGVLDDEVWQVSPLASDFIQYSPENGKKAVSELR
ncbi:MAG: hypothetical protein R2744_00395 [Bacteroidales bacterium]